MKIKKKLQFTEKKLSSRLLNICSLYYIKYNSGKVLCSHHPVLYIILCAAHSCTFHFLVVVQLFITILISVGSMQPCCNYRMECSNELAQDLRWQQEKSKLESLRQELYTVTTVSTCPTTHTTSQQTYTWARSGCYFTRVLYFYYYYFMKSL